jgi:peptidoglycan/LPS O-acetylase OafA/YrhL
MAGIKVAESVPPTAEGSRFPNDRLQSVDVLRGLAILAVVCNHSPHYAMGGFRNNPWFFPALAMDFGYLGVPLFVVISGFCIHRRAAIRKSRGDCQPPDWIKFWKRRFWRLYPPYVVAIAFSLVCESAISKKSLLESFDTVDLFSHLILVHNLTSQYASGLSNAAFWSLGMEEQLYFLYIPLLVLCLRKSMVFSVLIAACTTLGWRVLVGSNVLPASFCGLGSWFAWPFTYWMHWALGALAVEACFGVCRLPQWCRSRNLAIIVFSLGVVTNQLTFKFLSQTTPGRQIALDWQAPSFAFMSHVGELLFGVAFFVFLNHALLRDSKGSESSVISRQLAGIGKISYSVYLIHLPVIQLVEKYFPLSHSAQDWPIRMAMCVGGSLLAGMVFYFCVERWFLTGSREASKSSFAAL